MSKIDFTAIKASVTIQQVMDWLGIKVTKWEKSDQARCQCPCGAGDIRDLSINTTASIFTCFGSKPKASGDIITFVAHVKNVGLRDAAILLQTQFNTGQAHKPKPKIVAPGIANDNAPNTSEYGDALEAFISRLD